jgi:hypothetical protein
MPTTGAWQAGQMPNLASGDDFFAVAVRVTREERDLITALGF